MLPFKKRNETYSSILKASGDYEVNSFFSSKKTQKENNNLDDNNNSEESNISEFEAAKTKLANLAEKTEILTSPEKPSPDKELPENITAYNKKTPSPFDLPDIELDDDETIKFIPGENGEFTKIQLISHKFIKQEDEFEDTPEADNTVTINDYSDLDEQVSQNQTEITYQEANALFASLPNLDYEEDESDELKVHDKEDEVEENQENTEAIETIKDTDTTETKKYISAAFPFAAAMLLISIMSLYFVLYEDTVVRKISEWNYNRINQPDIQETLQITDLPKKVFKTPDNIKVYKGPGQQFGRLKDIPANSKVTITGIINETDWVKVEYSGNSGFIRKHNNIAL